MNHQNKFQVSVSELDGDNNKAELDEDDNEYMDSDSDGGINRLPFMMKTDTITVYEQGI